MLADEVQDDNFVMDVEGGEDDAFGVTSNVWFGIFATFCLIFIIHESMKLRNVRCPEGFNEAEKHLLALIKSGTTDAHLNEMLAFIHSRQKDIRPDTAQYDQDLDQHTTLLMYAVHNKWIKVAEELLKRKKANLLWDDKGRGMSALDMMADKTSGLHCKREHLFVRYVDEEEKEVYFNGPDGKVPDFGAAEEMFFQRMERMISDPRVLLKNLPGNRINPNSKTFFRVYHKNGSVELSTTTYSLLQYAVFLNNESAVWLLLSLGADPAWRNNKGANVLQFLAKRGNLIMAKIILDSIKDPEERIRNVDQTNLNGWTPLMAAIQKRQLLFATWLLEKEGADPNIEMTSGWTASHAANKKNESELQQLMRKNGGDNSIMANSYIYGKNTTPEVVLTYAREAREWERKQKEAQAMSEERINAMKLKSCQSQGKRALVAMANFFEEGKNNNTVDKRIKSKLPVRKGSTLDNQLAKVLEEKIDCKVKFRGKDEPFEIFVKRIQKEIQCPKEDYGILFFIVASHGGLDHLGQFLFDESGRKLHVRPYLLDKFVRAENCGSFMKDKTAVFMYNLCRSSYPGDINPTEFQKQESAKQMFLNNNSSNNIQLIDSSSGIQCQPFSESHYIQIQVCREGGVAFRRQDIGSLGIHALKEMVNKYGADLSLQDWVTQANEEVLSRLKVLYSDNKYTMNLKMESPSQEGVYFKPRN